MYKYPEMGKRLLEFSDSMGWHKAEFARRMNIHRQNVKAYFDGKLNPMNLALKFAENGGSIEWLRNGSGPMLLPEQFGLGPRSGGQNGSSSSSAMNALNLPFYFTPLNSGRGVNFHSPDATLNLQNIITAGVSAFVVQVSNDSMEPTISPNDFVIVKPAREARNGEVMVCTVNGETVLRRYSKTDAGVTLSADNSKYEAIKLEDIPVQDIHGVVLAVVSKP